MLRSTGYTRLTKAQRFSAAGVAAAGAAALTLTLVPGASGEDHTQSAAKTVQTQPVSFSQDSLVPAQRQSIDQQHDVAQQRAKDEAAAAKKKAEEARKKAEAAQQKAAAEKKAKQERAAKAAAAARKAQRAEIKSYPNNLDGWIREAQSIMKSKNIPGSYEGIKRNIMRESGGDPKAQNNTDINAQNGTPSKGLLQTIPATFAQYHVAGTANSVTDPVANIVAACNYAADNYGSIDNVDSAY